MKKGLFLGCMLVLLVGVFSVSEGGIFDIFKKNDAGKTKKVEELVMWNSQFVTEWAGREESSKYFKDNTKLKVSSDFGPSLYRDMSQKFIIQAKTGKPDVIEGTLEQLFSYAKAGLLMPIDEQFYSDSESENYNANVLDPLKVDGKLYGIPYNTNVRLLLYRKSIFKKYGLTPPTNWEELVKTAAFINKKEANMEGFVFTTKTREVRAFQEFMSFYLQLNKHMFKVTDGKVDYVATEAQLTQVLQLYYDMFFQGAISLEARGGDWKATDYGYTNGNCAMSTIGPWIWGHRYEDPARGDVLDDTGVIQLPVAKNGTPATYMEIKPMMINKFTKQPEKAYELLKESTSKGLQIVMNLKSGVMPGRKDSFADPKIANNPWLSAFGKFADTGVALDPIAWDQAQNKIIEAIQITIYEQKTPAEAGAWLNEELEKISKGL